MEYLFLLIQLGFAVFFFYLCLAFLTGAPFVPTTGNATGSMATLAELKPSDRVIDLGSGDGRLLLESANQGALVTGVEINPWLVLWSKIRSFLNPAGKRITVRWGNLWTTDLQKYDVVYIYLLPWKMDRLKKKLLAELKPGSRIVSNSFIFPDWKPDAVDERNHIYRFTVGPKGRASGDKEQHLR